MNLKVLHEYTHNLDGEPWPYRVVDGGKGVAIQAKCADGKSWVTIDYGSGPPEIARLAEKISELKNVCEQAIDWIEKAPIDKLENIEAEIGELFPITELKEALVKVQE